MKDIHKIIVDAIQIDKNKLKGIFYLLDEITDTEYAFYLMKDGKKVDERWYRDLPEVTFDINEDGYYYIIGYVKENNNKKYYKSNCINFTISQSKYQHTNTKIDISLKQRFRIIINQNYEEIRINGFRTRAQDNYFNVNLPITYKQTNNRNLEFNLQAWRHITHLWGKMFEDNNIFEYFKDWFDYKNGTLYWYDMAVGNRAIHIALALELQERYNILTLDKSAILFEMAKNHLDKLTNPNELTESNHAIWQMMGLKQLSITLKYEYGKKYANDTIKKLFFTAFDTDGVSIENSPFYHSYNINLLKLVDNKIFNEIRREIQDIMRKAEKITYWFVRQDDTFCRIGDTEGGLDKKQYKFYNNEDQIFLCDKKEVLIKDLRSSGYQILKSRQNENPFYFSFHIPNSKIHMHCDYLSFTLFQNGVEIFSDPGLFNYNFSKERQWFISDTAHNTFGLSEYVFLPDDVNLNSLHLNPIKIKTNKIILSGEIFIESFFKHKREISLLPYKNIKIIDDFILFKKTAPEIRFLFGSEIDIQYNDGKVLLLYKKKHIAEMLIQENFTNIDIIKKQDKKVFISKHFNQKEVTSQIVIQYDLDVNNIETNIMFYSE